MSLVELRGKVLRWGNSFGLRLSKGDVERLHVQPGQETSVFVAVDEAPLGAMDAPSFKLGGHAADDHDALAGRAALEDLGDGRS